MIPPAPDLEPAATLTTNCPPYEKPSPLNGSNNWALAGSRSATGYPLLANDMHLDLNLPSIWFLAQLQAPGLRVFGHIIPGVPVVIAGFNDSIAWGMTNAGRDLVDWYRIRFRNDSRQEYLYDGRWHETRKVVEEIRVRGSGAVYDTVVYTHHGPVVYDDRFPDSGSKSGLAMKWTGHQPSDELKTFLSLPKAVDYEDFRRAVRHFSSPPQNIVFAGAGGDIALHVQGRYPLRWTEQGKYILPGDTSAADWPGFIPFDQNPSIRNPHRGFVSSANQHPVDTLYPYYTYASHYEHFRNRRINARLDALKNASPDDMKDLQLDTYSLQAAEALPVMLGAVRSQPGDTARTAFLRELEGWDYRFEASSRAPALFNRWWRHLYRLAWDELTGGDPPFRLPSAYQTIQLMARQPDLSFWDIRNTGPTENLEQLVSTALDSAVREIGQWESRFGVAAWSRYQSTELRHLVPMLHTFGFKDLETGGDGSAPNAVTRYHGPSNRMIVALGPRLRAWCVYPGGQSGNPGSIHYGHFVPMWAEGRYAEMLYLPGPGTRDNSILFRQILNP
jgi:penicillin G amidase